MEHWTKMSERTTSVCFELFFAVLQVLGPNHPKTQRAKDTLKEPMYVRIKEARERVAAGTA